MLELTDASFNVEVREVPGPVVVDFWAPWCGPCKAISPVYAQLAEEYKDKAKFTKVNIDETGTIGPSAGVRSIPTFAIYKNGTIVDVMIGASGKTQMKAWLDKNLG